MPHPAILRRLVDEYEALAAEEGTAPSSRAQDLAYTLCVSTGTRDVRRALQTARHLLEATADPSVRVGSGPAATAANGTR